MARRGSWLAIALLWRAWAAPPLTDRQRQLNLKSFDIVWSTI